MGESVDFLKHRIDHDPLGTDDTVGLTVWGEHPATNVHPVSNQTTCSLNVWYVHTLADSLSLAIQTLLLMRWLYFSMALFSTLKGLTNTELLVSSSCKTTFQYKYWTVFISGFIVSKNVKKEILIMNHFCKVHFQQLATLLYHSMCCTHTHLAEFLFFIDWLIDCFKSSKP